MRQQEHGTVVPNRQAAQDANELPCLRSVVLIAGEQVGQRVQHQERRPIKRKLPIQFVMQGRRAQNLLLRQSGKKGFFASK
jgi:hypothetical protein